MLEGRDAQIEICASSHRWRGMTTLSVAASERFFALAFGRRAGRFAAQEASR
jgi:hypothetical protein